MSTRRSHARGGADRDEAGRDGYDAGDNQPGHRVGDVEGEADAEAGTDHDGRVVAVGVDQPGLPEPVVVAVGPGGRTAAAGGAAGTGCAGGQAVATLADPVAGHGQDEQADREGQGRQGRGGTGEPVDLPVAQGGQQHAEVHQRHQGQNGPGKRGQEPAVALGRAGRVGGFDVRPGSVDEQHQPGPQDSDVQLGGHYGEGSEEGLGYPATAPPRDQPGGQVGVAQDADDDGHRDHRQGGDQPAHREARRVSAPAGVGGHDLPTPGVPGFRGLDRDDLPPRQGVAAEVRGQLDEQDDPAQPP